MSRTPGPRATLLNLILGLLAFGAGALALVAVVLLARDVLG
jgi:hypothetical protein